MKTFTIGRGLDNNIVLNVPSVSGHHAELTYADDGSIILSDFSSNGTFVNGQVVRHNSVAVNYGDPIMFPGGVALDWSVLPTPTPPQPVYAQPSMPEEQYPNYASQQQSYSNHNDYSTGVDNNGGGNYGNVPPQSSQPMSSPIGSSQTLSFSRTFSEGFSSGLRNSISFSVIFILTILTCWVPYVNLGVFVALSMLPSKWANGEMINPLEIFSSEYRRQIGNFSLLILLMSSAVLLIMIPFVLPAYVFIFGWLLSPLMLLYRDMNPLEAMNASYRATYGSKWTMLGVFIVFALSALFAMLPGLGVILWGVETESVALVILGGLLNLVAAVIMSSVRIGIMGSIWNQLKDKNVY